MFKTALALSFWVAICAVRSDNELLMAQSMTARRRRNWTRGRREEYLLSQRAQRCRRPGLSMGYGRRQRPLRVICMVAIAIEVDIDDTATTPRHGGIQAQRSTFRVNWTCPRFSLTIDCQMHFKDFLGQTFSIHLLEKGYSSKLGLSFRCSSPHLTTFRHLRVRRVPEML